MLLRRHGLQAATGLVGAFVVGIAPASAQAQTSTDRLALKGYDPVAYFTLSAPTPGVAQYEYVYDGSRYRFANAKHLAMFKASPEKYAPQFGGLCANNMSNGVRRGVGPCSLDNCKRQALRLRRDCRQGPVSVGSSYFGCSGRIQLERVEEYDQPIIRLNGDSKPAATLSVPTSPMLRPASVCPTIARPRTG